MHWARSTGPACRCPPRGSEPAAPAAPGRRGGPGRCGGGSGRLGRSLHLGRLHVAPNGQRREHARLTAVDGQGAAVTFHFDGAFPGWRRLFSGADFLLPAHRLAGKDPRLEWRQGPDLAGGPFRLGAVTPGLSVVLERNDSWWGAK